MRLWHRAMQVLPSVNRVHKQLRTRLWLLTGLGVDWAEVTTVDIYTVHPLESFLRELLGRSFWNGERLNQHVGGNT